MKYSFLLSAFLFSMLLPLASAAQSTAALSGIAPLFEAQEALQLTLKTNLNVLLKDRGDERDEHQATVSYQIADGSTVEQKLKVEVRGNFRRNKKHCAFPPLRLNFPKKDVQGTLFDGQDKLKLVTHCQKNAYAYEQQVLLEYLSYKIYNLLTPLSFQVRLVEVTYTDNSGEEKPETYHGFLIEDDDAMASRNGGVKLDKTGYHQEATDNDHVTMLSLFQYMIGNTDWSVPALHNIELIYIDGRPYPFAVPYDFDFSGLVNAPYASPSPVLPIKEVTDRLYRGYCRPEEALQPHISLFLERKDQMYALFQDMPALQKKFRRRAISYLDSFFQVLESDKYAEREFVKSCRER